MKYGLLSLLWFSSLTWAADYEVSVRELPKHRHADYESVMQAKYRRALKNAQQHRPQRETTQATDHTVEHIWPVRKAISAPAWEVNNVSFYLDQDDSGGIQDWNCGDRAYDGHNGVDIQMSPFNWYQMRRDRSIIIAGADGMIIEKTDDQPEDSCQANTNDGDNNSIIIEHADGSWSVYAHMRTNSLTKKAVGEMVEAGEYLGVIGSAGISTGPHLHFGVGFLEDQGTFLEFVEQDPWSGTCNAINAETWWENQPDYLMPALMDISTHDAAPEYPPCPQSEVPHYASTFSAGDDIIFGWVIRDQPSGQVVSTVIRMPNGMPLFGSPIETGGDVDRPGGLFWSVGTSLPGSAMAGEWKVEVTFMGETYSHSFWVDQSPPSPGKPPVGNNAYNGLWYDPGLDGEGYNIVTAEAGTIIYFYGSDSKGNRFWLISDLITEGFRDGRMASIVMYESTGGTYPAPIASARGLSVWGLLKITFTDCGSGTAVLEGEDGSKTSAIVKLAAVPGTNCGDPATDEALLSGLWFDASLEGEGYNVIISPFGAVVYYYGFDKDGNRLWLIAGPITQALTPGSTRTADLLKATSGTFDSPSPSDQLVNWGTLTIEVTSCTAMIISMDTPDGDKESDSVHLANITGLPCS